MRSNQKYFLIIAFWMTLLMPPCSNDTQLKDVVSSHNPGYTTASLGSISCSIGFIYESACPHVSSRLTGRSQGTTLEQTRRLLHCCWAFCVLKCRWSLVGPVCYCNVMQKGIERTWFDYCLVLVMLLSGFTCPFLGPTRTQRHLMFRSVLLSSVLGITTVANFCGLLLCP